VIDFLQPQNKVEKLPEDPEAARYVRSYLKLRFLVGLIGVALPLALVFGDALVLDERHPFLRDSLSAYYYSGTRDLFVGGLVATGIFLICYKVSERSLDNTLSNVAGLAAILIALCPTKPPAGDVTLTALQVQFGETFLSVDHATFATVFIVSLGVISVFFGIREGRRDPPGGKRSPTFWRNYHWLCAGVIGVAIAWVIVTQFAGWPRTSLLFGETASVWAFGVSWFMKGYDRPRRVRPKAPSRAR
jgi:hypothetical protein